MRDTVNLDALTRPLSLAAARAVIADLPSGVEKPKYRLRDFSGGRRVVMVLLEVVRWVLTALAAAALLLAAVSFIRDIIASPGSMLPGVVLVVTIVAAVAVVAERERRRAPLRRARLVTLARDNGWDYEPVGRGPRHSGALFDIGTERTVHDLIRFRRNPRIEIADYSCRVSNGKSDVTLRYAYLAIALPQRLPHIALDSVRSTGKKRSPLALSEQFAADQHLSLEGDFDTHFRLFAPAGYEQDALYLFTPDIMALFIDHAGSYDVEIIDGWLLLYGLPQTLTEPIPERWEATLDIITALETKLDQWDRWRDQSKKKHAPRGTPRSLARPKPGVAEAGGRLRPRRIRDRARQVSVIAGAIIAILGVSFSVIIMMLWGDVF